MCCLHCFRKTFDLFRSNKYIFYVILRSTFVLLLHNESSCLQWRNVFCLKGVLLCLMIKKIIPYLHVFCDNEYGSIFWANAIKLDKINVLKSGHQFCFFDEIILWHRSFFHHFYGNIDCSYITKIVILELVVLVCEI